MTEDYASAEDIASAKLADVRRIIAAGEATTEAKLDAVRRTVRMETQR